MLKTVFVLAAVALFSVLATPVSTGWNELLRGAELFDGESNFIKSRSNDRAVIARELWDLLSQDGFLAKIYGKYQKLYNKDQPAYLYLYTFKSNLISIATHNLEAENGKYSWFKGINQFTDLTAKQFEHRYAVNVSSWADSVTEENQVMPKRTLPSYDPVQGAPDSLDYSAMEGVITEVKDQSDCNSCVMFSISAQLEGVDALTQQRPSANLSPQQLLDCAVTDFECWYPGTQPIDTLEYIKANPVTTWEEYPYNYPPVKEECAAEGKSAQAQVAQFGLNIDIEEDHLKSLVAQFGPVMVGIYSGYEYNGGILDNSACGYNNANHAVLVVGYGSENGKDFWKIKNSYGPTWGESGYLRLARNANHACRISSFAAAITTL